MSPGTEEAAILHHDLQAVKRCRTRPWNSAGYPSCHQALPPISRMFSLFSNVIWNSYARTGTQAQVYNRERQAATAQEQPRGATPRPEPGAAERSNATSKERQLRGCWRAEKSNPTSKEWWLHGLRRAKRTYSLSKVRRAAMRRYPSSKVRSSGCALLEQP